MMATMPSPTPIVLTSRTNPRIVEVASLRDRRARERTGLTVIDGAREVRRAIESGAELVEAFVCGTRLAGPDARAALDALAARHVPTTSVSEPVLEKIAFGDRAEGIVATVRIPDLALAHLALPADPLVVIVEGVEKPGNLGAILRSADGAGADALVAASPRTDLFNPNAIRASAGTIFRVPLGGGVVHRGPRLGAERRACDSSRPASVPSDATRTRTSRARSASSSAPKPRA